MNTMRWCVTPHAIRRYIERHAPQLTFVEARVLLFRHLEQVYFPPEKLVLDEIHVTLKELGAIVVVKPNPTVQGGLVAVTVLLPRVEREVWHYRNRRERLRRGRIRTTDQQGEA